MARVVIAILKALFHRRPRYALGLKINQLVHLLKIMADWKTGFMRICPGIYRLYYTGTNTFNISSSSW